MKKNIGLAVLAAVALLMVAGCPKGSGPFDFNGQNDRGSEDGSDMTNGKVPGDVQFASVQKIVINGLSEAVGSGNLEKIDLYYAPAGKVYDDQTHIVYTESGEYVFSELIDVQGLSFVPSTSPPRYFLPWTFEGSTLTLNLEEGPGLVNWVWDDQTGKYRDDRTGKYWDD